MPWPCGRLAAPYVTACSSEFPQVDRPSRRDDTLAREASRGVVSGKSLLRPAGRRFELEFTFLDRAPIRGEGDEAARRRLASYLTQLVRAQRATVVSVDLHDAATVPPWPYVIVLSVPMSGWTVEKALHLADSATALLRAVGAGAFSRDVVVQVLRADHPEALLGQPESICLDVKLQHYDFSAAAGKISLA
jgi:hypothetical protein